MANLTPNLALEELVASDTTARLGIDTSTSPGDRKAAAYRGPSGTDSHAPRRRAGAGEQRLSLSGSQPRAAQRRHQRTYTWPSRRLRGAGLRVAFGGMPLPGVAPGDAAVRPVDPRVWILGAYRAAHPLATRRPSDDQQHRDTDRPVLATAHRSTGASLLGHQPTRSARILHRHQPRALPRGTTQRCRRRGYVTGFASRAHDHRCPG